MPDREVTRELREDGIPVGKPFTKGNPGRPKGARNKLGEAFIQALHDDFEEHGVAAIQVVRAEKPDQYLKVIASLLPKEHRIEIGDQFADMSEEELVDRIRSLAAVVSPFLSGRDGGVNEGAASKTIEQIASRIH